MSLLTWLNTYFTKAEKLLWASSIALILTVFLLFDRSNYLTLSASLLGATALIFMAKGHPISQAMIIVFSALYGIVSYSFSYYGEVITYLGMTAPMAIWALVSWLRNPYKGNRAEVTVNHIKRWEIFLLFPLTAVVTVVFYFILETFGTANLIPSTFSITTSFVAAYLTARRSAYYALAYALNDAVLIVLWLLATLENPSYVSMMVCFIMFLANDLYGFISWRKMSKKQTA